MLMPPKLKPQALMPYATFSYPRTAPRSPPEFCTSLENERRPVYADEHNQYLSQRVQQNYVLETITLILGWKF